MESPQRKGEAIKNCAHDPAALWNKTEEKTMNMLMKVRRSFWTEARDATTAMNGTSANARSDDESLSRRRGNDSWVNSSI